MRRAGVAALAAICVAASLMAAPQGLGAIPLHGRAAKASGHIAKPPIVWKPIPYRRTRLDEMAAYSRRHYGKRTYVLSDPKVIVEHYTAGTTFSGAWGTFASNARHNGELPGTCAHFVIDTDGTIYQLVKLGVRCRHAVGMNWTAIGIEHVGTSDQMVLGNHAQMRASLRLTLWLMQRYDINVGNVIGHAETLESPYHRERYASWRCLVHADFPHWAMKKYRTRLRAMATRRAIRVGAGPVWVASGC